MGRQTATGNWQTWCDVTWRGRAFHVGAAEMGKARSLTIGSLHSGQVYALHTRSEV